MGDSASENETRAIDQRFAEALAQADYRMAATLALRTYGSEILRLLAALHRSEETAAEVFACFAEAVWKAAPAFEGRSSVRTWSYAIARRVSLHYRRDERRRQARLAPLADDASFAELEAKIRTETLTFLRTERKTRLAALRDRLPIEDQELLVLRIDRKLAWRELAIVLGAREGVSEGEGVGVGVGVGAGVGEALSEDELKREAARLRKRFQSLKERLRETARKEGLLTDSGGL